MQIKDIIQVIEEFAPLQLQESYDNAGLIIGDFEQEVKGVLLCLDSTEEILDEALKKGCNVIIAHHPIVFSGLKKINGGNYIERVIIKAIKNNIAIYAAHTNIDNVMEGVNGKICDKLGLGQREILSPKSNYLKKLVTFCPLLQADAVRQALFVAGAGHIGKYDECSYNTEGTGTFRPSQGAAPFVGEVGKQQQEKEIKIETIFPAYLKSRILKALFTSHPYEEVAYDIIPVENKYQGSGSGIIAELGEEQSEVEFLKMVKERMKVSVIRHTSLLNKPIKKVAVCGGSGSFLLSRAIAAGADIFITSDFKYHQFFDAENKIIIADIGHYESEQFTIEIFYRLLIENFPKFAVSLSEINTNPINYLK